MAQRRARAARVAQHSSLAARACPDERNDPRMCPVPRALSRRPGCRCAPPGRTASSTPEFGLPMQASDGGARSGGHPGAGRGSCWVGNSSGSPPDRLSAHETTIRDTYKFRCLLRPPGTVLQPPGATSYTGAAPLADAPRGQPLCPRQELNVMSAWAAARARGGPACGVDTPLQNHAVWCPATSAQLARTHGLRSCPQPPD
jgi:hypothetical protein